MELRYRMQGYGRAIAEFFEDKAFDLARHVRTAGNVTLGRAGITHVGDSELYVPARPWQVRQAIRAAPVADPSEYTYVDLGSGKGRTLFVAAELPFREVIGVEFSRVLHDRATDNVRTFRHPGRRCGPIRSVHTNATDFVFPDGPVVVYLFNPFGAETMRRVFDNLAASLRNHPRHVVVVLLWPKQADQVACVDGMRLVAHPSEWLQVFEAHRPGSGHCGPVASIACSHGPR